MQRDSDSLFVPALGMMWLAQGHMTHVRSCPGGFRYGGCVGDLPPYDAFTLGGPYSVRGYSMGELGAARRVLEVGRGGVG